MADGDQAPRDPAAAVAGVVGGNVNPRQAAGDAGAAGAAGNVRAAGAAGDAGAAGAVAAEVRIYFILQFYPSFYCFYFN